MDAVLQPRFDGLEKALTTLIDSIVSFNPSPHAAVDLVAADDALSEALAQLEKHQANHSRILALRAEADALEAHLKASVRTLAQLRREILRLPMSQSAVNARPVSSAELLQYAKHISQHTVPLTYREHIPRGTSEAEEVKEKGNVTSPLVPANGLGTPAAHGGPAPAPTGDTTKENAPTASVTAQQAEWLKDMREKGLSWVPWPDDSKIRSGNLMACQHLLDRGKDPWTESAPTKQEMDHVAREEAEAAEAEAKGHAQEAEPAEKRDHAAHPPRVDPQQVAQFTGFDFDDDD
ncbi:uncharacterized protein EI97DRAFT_388332 [Westerdykella ornata]|uniref:Mediator of RNA polymerase II transcription subunit 4 n=1 Tax=Westerdykella ornata TaxID=318751 RepID=A0A6A6J3V6_WESOR|nr:uncharacterized protein EI97DRAFT_388332 [Westerdykella ornata]KAF2271250.1 hypothetical protein EI97DRAFT_388332 [Westerdykella ornata]